MFHLHLSGFINFNLSKRSGINCHFIKKRYHGVLNGPQQVAGDKVTQVKVSALGANSYGLHNLSISY